MVDIDLDKRYWAKTEIQEALSKKVDNTNIKTINNESVIGQGNIAITYKNITNKPRINGYELDGNKSLADLGIQNLLDNKQDKLYSGQTIKTLNNINLLGEGNITLDQIGLNISDLNVYSKDDIDLKLSFQQDKLVSQINIKTINNNDIIGSGNLSFNDLGFNDIVYIKSQVDNFLERKQDVLIPGEGINISNNIISASSYFGDEETITLENNTFSVKKDLYATKESIDNLAIRLSDLEEVVTNPPIIEVNPNPSTNLDIDIEDYTYSKSVIDDKTKIDYVLSTSSLRPVQNKIITKALNSKADDIIVQELRQTVQDLSDMLQHANERIFELEAKIASQ